METKQRKHRSRRAVLGALGLLTLGSASAPQDAGRVGETRSALERWVETRRILSAERRDWDLGREMLQERIGVVRRELEAVRERIAEAQASLAEADAKRAELLAEQELLQRSSATLEAGIGALEARTRELLQRVPEPIRERVAPLAQRLREDPASVQASLGERFQNVIGILDGVNRFQREISVTSEVRDLGDGTSVEVAVIYVGLGQAFYASSSGSAAGVGRATASGWAWTREDEAAAAIDRVRAILENEQGAAFVRLPVRVE